MSPSFKSSPDLLQECGPLFGSGMVHVVMAEIHARCFVFSGRYAPDRSTYETSKTCAVHATRNTNPPHTFAFQRASRAELARLALLRPRASRRSEDRQCSLKQGST
jgi:hypothetical protein